MTQELLHGLQTARSVQHTLPCRVPRWCKQIAADSAELQRIAEALAAIRAVRERLYPRRQVLASGQQTTNAPAGGDGGADQSLDSRGTLTRARTVCGGLRGR